MAYSFAHKKILLGITGGIAAYKSAVLVRELIKQGAAVRVMMTEAASRFVTPLTFETLSDYPVAMDMFDSHRTSSTWHIEWARWPDVIIICPATANTIAKVAHGVADNMVTTILMAAKTPIIFCPAMNCEMYKNRFYQHNEQLLRENGHFVIAPEEGELACGEKGVGRLADLNDIVSETYWVLNQTNSLADKKVVVTAGPTREAIDPVRFISNRSSGKMGYALAENAAIRGAHVTLISGPTALKPPRHVHFKSVDSAQEMASAVAESAAESDILIMSAAVADFRPKEKSSQKLKKDEFGFNLQLEPTTDILKSAAGHKKNQIIVGFALETENVLENGKKKLAQKNCDLMVVNNPFVAGAGFDVDTNQGYLVFRNQEPIHLPLMSKWDMAGEILNHIERLSIDHKY